MRVQFNDDPVKLAPGSTLGDLLRTQDLAGQSGFAVAVNEEVVPRQDWDTHRLKESDTVLVVRAFKGG